MAGNLNVGSINDVGFMPINLAINPEFTINQRGAASPTAATGYNYDRWYYDGSNLLQGIENLNLRATTYVVSWEGSATCSYSLNTAASSSQGSQTYTSITNGGTLTIASVSSNNLWIKFSGTLTGLTKVSVVPSGTKSPFLPRQYQQELALCQRYCYVLNPANNYYTRFSGGPNGSTTQGTAYFNFPVTMRTVPSLYWSAGGGSYYDYTTGATGNAATISADGNTLNTAFVVFPYSSGTVTNGALSFIRINNNASWTAQFSSEL